MPKLLMYLMVISFLASPLHSQAQTDIITPGEYITNEGWGTMTIKQGKRGDLTFEISTIGVNGHSCNLSGTIHNGRSVLQEGSDDKPCIVTFKPTERGIDVTDNEGACRYYCGARAGFTDLYLEPPPGCDSVSVKKTRKDFKKLYDQKAYAQARTKLEPVVQNCSSVIYWWDMGWIRNDLAITQYKLGDYAGCRSTLQPLEEDAGKTDKVLEESNYPPDAEMLIPIARAARTNLKLCASGRKKKSRSSQASK